MRRSYLAGIVALGCVCAAGGLFAAGLTATNYVQNGLVLQFDGLDNAGTGTHDASATRWKDLKGSAYIETGSGITFGSRWLYLDFKKGPISGLPTGLKNNPISLDFSLNLITNYTTSTATTWPSLLQGSSLNFHSTGIKAGSATGRGFRLFINGTDPRPYVYNVYTNTLTCISDETSIRILKDGVFQDSCTNKAPVTMTYLRLNDSEFARVQFYTFRVYNRGLSEDEAQDNARIDRLRYLAPRLAGSGGTVAWSGNAWTDPDGAAAAAPSTATNGYAVVRNASAQVAASDNVGLMALSLEDGATLALASDAIVSTRYLYVEGAPVARGIYTGTGAIGTQVSWLTGEGVVRVACARTGLFPETYATPAADGWYEIGNPETPVYDNGKGYSGAPNGSYHRFNGDRWTADDYARTVFPAGAKLRLVGGLITDTIPTDGFSEIDTTNALKYIVFRAKTVFSDARTFVVAPACTARYQPGTWQLDGGRRWLTDSYTASTQVGTTFYGDLEVNGSLLTTMDDSHLSDATFAGKISGAKSGLLRVSSFTNFQRFSGDEFAFNGKLEANSNGTGFLIRPKRVTGRIDSLSCSACGGDYQFNTYYCAAGLLFGPQPGKPTCEGELYIGTISGNASQNWSGGTLWRNGGVVIVWGTNTVHAGTVSRSLHVIAHRQDQNCKNAFFGDISCFGTGNFIADTVSNWANLFLGTNVYVTVG